MFSELLLLYLYFCFYFLISFTLAFWLPYRNPHFVLNCFTLTVFWDMLQQFQQFAVILVPSFLLWIFSYFVFTKLFNFDHLPRVFSILSNLSSLHMRYRLLDSRIMKTLPKHSNFTETEKHSKVKFI